MVLISGKVHYNVALNECVFEYTVNVATGYYEGVINAATNGTVLFHSSITWKKATAMRAQEISQFLLRTTVKNSTTS